MPRLFRTLRTSTAIATTSTGTGKLHPIALVLRRLLGVEAVEGVGIVAVAQAEAEMVELPRHHRHLLHRLLRPRLRREASRWSQIAEEASYPQVSWDLEVVNYEH